MTYLFSDSRVRHSPSSLVASTLPVLSGLLGGCAMLLFASPMPGFWQKLAGMPATPVIALLVMVGIVLAIKEWGQRYKS